VPPSPQRHTPAETSKARACMSGADTTAPLEDRPLLWEEKRPVPSAHVETPLGWATTARPLHGVKEHPLSALQERPTPQKLSSVSARFCGDGISAVTPSHLPINMQPSFYPKQLITRTAAQFLPAHDTVSTVTIEMWCTRSR
jgi:hypothetical protein